MKRFFLPILSATAWFLLSCDGSDAPSPATAGTEHEKEQAEATPAEAPQPAVARDEVPLNEEMTVLIAAAENGDAVAQNNLALAYAEGKEIAKDDSRAFELFRQASEQGHAVAAFNLARCYALGEGTAPDEAAFIAACTQAAQAGFAPAQYTLGCAYRDGLGVTADPIEAERWLSRAEMNGYEPAKAAWKELQTRNAAERL